MKLLKVTKQAGSALLLSLVILLVLSVLAVSGMQGSIMQERMVGAQREGMIALEAAEEGARFGEQWVQDNVLTLTIFNGQTPGLYDIRDVSRRAPSPYDEATWDASNVQEADEVDGITPVFIVEYLGEGFRSEQLTDGMIGGYSHESGAMDVRAFRVIARAEGPSGQARRLIEVYFTKQI